MTEPIYIYRHPEDSWWGFQYSVWRGGPWPRGRILGVALTRRGAERIARRHAKIAPPHDPVLIGKLP
uniref:Uncharacterized protein n=1 Tax=viral metagenome TaxID=1070528 RepID=A0A6M3LMQ8_9ZZZZ